MKSISLSGLLAVSALIQACQPSTGNEESPSKPSISINLGNTNIESGIQQVMWDKDTNGKQSTNSIGGSDCLTLSVEKGKEAYLYFRLDPSFKGTNTTTMHVNVEYYDAMPGSFDIEYDGSDTWAPMAGAYTRVRNKITHSGKKQWASADFTLKRAKFRNSQNGGADFRLRIWTPEFHVRRITASRYRTTLGAKKAPQMASP